MNFALNAQVRLARVPFFYRVPPWSVHLTVCTHFFDERVLLLFLVISVGRGEGVLVLARDPGDGRD